jgi:uncharacterized protein (TIGR02687 family)
MTEDRIVNGLRAQFERHRIVFWYDVKQEMREAYDALDLPDVKKLEINNNEFGIKYQVLHQQPEQKFLIYKFGAPPQNYIDNWLLDIELAHGRFRTEQVQLWLDELGLPPNLADTLREHEKFFGSSTRLAALKSTVSTNDDALTLKAKMLLICTNSQQDMEGVIATLFSELAQDSESTFKLLTRCNLDGFFWDQLKRLYGYASDEPSVADFAITLFLSSFKLACSQTAQLNAEAHLLFRRWKNDRNNTAVFEKLSSDYGEVLNIAKATEQIELQTMLEIDYFKVIDRHIIKSLIEAITNQTIPRNDARNMIRMRRNSHFFDQFYHVYGALSAASELLHEMSNINLGMEGFDDGINRYTNTWYKIDQYYRKFIHNYRKSAQPTLLNDLCTLIENKYGNDFLLKVNDIWQRQIDTLDNWDSAEFPLQRDFFKKFVSPLQNKDTKSVVIISDAMRFEIGQELLSLVRERDRFDAEIEPLLASVPSYTQLGMASLLPNQNLSVSDSENALVTLSGKSTSGIENRKSILAEHNSEIRTCAFHAADISDFKSAEMKELVKEHDVIYVYHNVIDAAGDSSKSEDTVFQAAETALQEITRLIQKFTSGNARYIFVTADHGFIYQNRKIEESDYLGDAPVGEAINHKDRRFVVGSGLSESINFKKFTSEQVGLEGNTEFLFPKSINRLRKSGSGSKYVHGGLALQEIIVPVVKIYKGRQSDISPVEISILSSPTKTITTSQLSVKLYQESAVSEKVHARTLRLGLFSKDGELVSDSHTIVFDNESDSPREREIQTRLLLGKTADKFNNQEVALRLEEQHQNTSTFKVYKEEKYLLKRSFSNDFDF